jgi:hypothetical protein
MGGQSIYSTASDFLSLCGHFSRFFPKPSNSSKSEQASLKSVYDRNYAGIEIGQEFVKTARTRTTLLRDGQGEVR